MKHVELIIDYLIDGTDFQYFDNTGTIVRCKDCKHVEYRPASSFSSWKRPYACRITSKGLGYCPDDGNGFCPYGERKESEIEIVRCKDCEYWDTSWTEDSTGFCGNVDGRTTPDFFCADGERKESEEE